MSIWQLLKKWRMGSQQKKQYHFVLGVPLTFHPPYTATQEPDQLNSRSQAVSPPDLKKDELYKLWILLSPRQQDLVAYACLGYTNSQIGARLGLTTVTVKSYFVRILVRLGLKSKSDIRVKFANWDFSAWERRNHHR